MYQKRLPTHTSNRNAGLKTSNNSPEEVDFSGFVAFAPIQRKMLDLSFGVFDNPDELTLVVKEHDHAKCFQHNCRCLLSVIVVLTKSRPRIAWQDPKPVDLVR